MTIFEKAGRRADRPVAAAPASRPAPASPFTAEEVTVSAINRNFPGRSGPGQVYLASPLVVAASAEEL
jgi:3-isopropylmalate/(R)-2-methylmalate dehydratase large subunit